MDRGQRTRDSGQLIGTVDRGQGTIDRLQLTVDNG